MTTTPALSRQAKATSSAVGTMAAAAGGESEYVTLHVGTQLFGLPIDEVHEVFAANQITRVPLAPPAIKGLLNLRGKVVTAVCLRTVLGLPETDTAGERMAIGVEEGGEAFALLVDRIGDVMRLSAATHEANPIHLEAGWQDLARGVHRLETTILVVLDLGRVIGSERLADHAPASVRTSS